MKRTIMRTANAKRQAGNVTRTAGADWLLYDGGIALYKLPDRANDNQVGSGKDNVIETLISRVKRNITHAYGVQTIEPGPRYNDLDLMKIGGGYFNKELFRWIDENACYYQDGKPGDPVVIENEDGETIAIVCPIRYVAPEKKEGEKMLNASKAIEQIERATLEEMNREQNEKNEFTNIAPEDVKKAAAEKIDATGLTIENIHEYLPSLLWTVNRKTNAGIIVSAAIEAGAMSDAEIVDYFKRGTMPALHTFDVWQANGYSVKKGSKALFSAYIWKHTTKKVESKGKDRETGEIETEEIETERFVKVKAYFFGADQVEERERVELETIPADCKKTVAGAYEIVSGNTRPIKDALKAAGYRWNKKNSYWFRRAA